MDVYICDHCSWICAGCAELLRSELAQLGKQANLVGPFSMTNTWKEWSAPMHCYYEWRCVNAIPLREGGIVKTGEEARGNQWGAFLENSPLKPEALEVLRASFVDPVPHTDNVSKIYRAFYGI